jgi:hypothetical protein
VKTAFREIRSEVFKTSWITKANSYSKKRMILLDSNLKQEAHSRPDLMTRRDNTIIKWKTCKELSMKRKLKGSNRRMNGLTFMET